MLSHTGTQTHGLLRIVAHAFVPLKRKLGVIYLQHKKVGLTVTFKHQGCFARLSLQLAVSVVSTALATRFLSTPQRQHLTLSVFYTRSFIQHYR